MTIDQLSYYAHCCQNPFNLPRPLYLSNESIIRIPEIIYNSIHAISKSNGELGNIFSNLFSITYSITGRDPLFMRPARFTPIGASDKVYNSGVWVLNGVIDFFDECGRSSVDISLRITSDYPDYYDSRRWRREYNDFDFKQKIMRHLHSTYKKCCDECDKYNKKTMDLHRAVRKITKLIDLALRLTKCLV